MSEEEGTYQAGEVLEHTAEMEPMQVPDIQCPHERLGLVAAERDGTVSPEGHGRGMGMGVRTMLEMGWLQANSPCEKRDMSATVRRFGPADTTAEREGEGVEGGGRGEGSGGETPLTSIRVVVESRRHRVAY